MDEFGMDMETSMNHSVEGLAANRKQILALQLIVSVQSLHSLHTV